MTVEAKSKSNLNIENKKKYSAKLFFYRVIFFDCSQETCTERLNSPTSESVGLNIPESEETKRHPKCQEIDPCLRLPLSPVDRKVQVSMDNI